MDEIKCPKCEKTFTTEDALEMHKKSKHPEEAKKSPFFHTHKKKIKTWGIVLIVLLALGAGIFGLSKTAVDCNTIPAPEMNIGSHSGVSQHIHTQLEIYINGNKEFIPPSVGLGQNFMRPLHTHEADGIIHNESPCARDFTLGEFFSVWGKTFNKNCIFDHCVDENHTLKILVNGKENSEYEDILLKDSDKIQIYYEEKNATS